MTVYVGDVYIAPEIKEYFKIIKVKESECICVTGCRQPTIEDAIKESVNEYQILDRENRVSYLINTNTGECLGKRSEFDLDLSKVCFRTLEAEMKEAERLRKEEFKEFTPALREDIKVYRPLRFKNDRFHKGQ